MSSYCGIINIGDVKTMKDNRLFRILYYILEKGKVTAKELADKFGEGTAQYVCDAIQQYVKQEKGEK